MHSVSIPQRVRQFADSLRLRGSRLLIGVSGGSDSVALLHLMVRLSDPLGIGEIGVAHFNHGLRGEESDGDEAFVAGIARDAGLPFFVDRTHGKTMSDPGIEAWARAGRYAFFDRVRAARGYDRVATGHTADDQAETVLLRLARGCGSRGLEGIHRSRADGIVRPLLTVRRAELIGWLEQEGIPFRTDSSNVDTHVQRNWIRHEILSLLDTHGAGSVEALADCALRKQHEADELAEAVNKWRNANVFISNGHTHIRKEGLADARLAAESTVGILAERGVCADRRKVEALVDESGRTGSRLLLGNGWRATRTRNGIDIAQGESEEHIEPFEFELTVPGTTTCGGIAVLHTEICTPADLPAQFPPDKLTAYLDAGRIRALRFRSFRKGERFPPHGSDGERDVGSFLKKQGFSSRQRNKMGVVAEGKGAIVWIPGGRISQLFRVGPETKNIIRLSCRYKSQYNVF